MSEQPQIYEGLLEMIWDINRTIKEQGDEFDRRMKEIERVIHESNNAILATALQIKETNSKLHRLGCRMGQIVENIVGNKIEQIIKQFDTLGYKIEGFARNKKFGIGLSKDMQGEIDLFLENDKIVILFEVKTALTCLHINRHIRRLDRRSLVFGYLTARYGCRAIGIENPAPVVRRIP